MKNFFNILLIFLFISNCTLNKVILHHGVHFLDAKQKKIIINKTNRNDLYKELGPPSTIGRFDKEILIYIEKKTTSSRITKLGKKELLVNDVLVLEVNKKGIIVSKKFLNKDDINNMSFVKNTTGISYDKDAFLYGFIKTLRQKINDPLGKKRGN